MKVTCPNCGTLCESDTQFCHVCGTYFQSDMSPVDENDNGLTGEFTSDYAAYESTKTENEVSGTNQIDATDSKSKKSQKKSKKSAKKFIVIGAIIVVLILAIVLIAKGCSNDSNNGNEGIDKNNPIGKTVMIYVVGSDLESEGKYATVDLSEISRSGVDTEANNVLVCTGGAAKWHNDYVSADENAIFKLNVDSFEKVESYPLSNMAESSTLSRFISYGMTAHPNDQYILILWNHGGGPILGYGADELFLTESGISDLLTMEELQSSLEEANIGNENKFELIGFDACIMSNIETAWCLKDYANYLVASQETEPGTGWDYSFLKDLEYYQDGKALATKIIDTYYTTTLKEYRSDVELTLSCLDLSKIEKTEACLNDLFTDVNTSISEDGFAELSQKRYETKAFAKSSDPEDFPMDIVDLNHMATLLEDKYPEKVKALKESISELVCYSKTNIENAAGVSIWYPFESAEYIESFMDIYGKYDFAENYTKYVYNFSLTMLGVSPEDLENYNNNTISASGNNSIGLSLTPEQMATIAGAEYVIYYKIPAKDSISGSDEYLPVYCGQDFTIDESGTLYVTYNTSAIFAIDESTGDDSGVPLALNYIYDGSSELKLYAEAYFSDSTTGAKAKDVIWTVNVDGDTVEFGNAKPITEKENDIAAQKELINPDDYNTYYIGNPSYYANTDEEGFTYLTKSGSGYGLVLNKQSGYHLEYREIEDIENYYIAIYITDIYCQTYSTSLKSLAQ